MRRARVLGLSPSPGPAICPSKPALVPPEGESGDLGSGPGAPLIPWRLLSPSVKGGSGGDGGSRGPVESRGHSALSVQTDPEFTPQKPREKQASGPEPAGRHPRHRSGARAAAPSARPPVAEFPFGKGLPGSSGRPWALGHAFLLQGACPRCELARAQQVTRRLPHRL